MVAASEVESAKLTAFAYHHLLPTNERNKNKEIYWFQNLKNDIKLNTKKISKTNLSVLIKGAKYSADKSHKQSSKQECLPVLCQTESDFYNCPYKQKSMNTYRCYTEKISHSAL